MAFEAQKVNRGEQWKSEAVKWQEILNCDNVVEHQGYKGES